MNSRYSLRKFFTDVHLWLGIASGLVLFVVCLTGTIYTFRAEIERATGGSKYYVKSVNQSGKLPVDSLVHRVETQFKGKVTSLQIPADAGLNYLVSLKPAAQNNARGGQQKEGEARPEARPAVYFVDPFTGKVAGKQGGGSSGFFTTVLQLHRWLLMEHSIGTRIVGVSTFIFVFIIISGLVIWVPKRIKHIRDGLVIKFSSNWKRINHDLHSVLGFYAMLVLLVMALTGLCWSFEWYKDGLGKLLGAKVFRGRNEKPLKSTGDARNLAVLPLAAHIAKANALFNYTGDLRIALPVDNAGSIGVTKNKTGFFAFSGADKVQFDQFTGDPLKIERFDAKPLNQKIADSVRPLHTGEIYGMFSKIIYFIACLIATSLPVTGTIIWINKLKKKARRKRSQKEFTTEAIA